MSERGAFRKGAPQGEGAEITERRVKAARFLVRVAFDPPSYPASNREIRTVWGRTAKGASLTEERSS